jgi:hypothetical protein
MESLGSWLKQTSRTPTTPGDTKEAAGKGDCDTDNFTKKYGQPSDTPDKTRKPHAGQPSDMAAKQHKAAEQQDSRAGSRQGTTKANPLTSKSLYKPTGEKHSVGYYFKCSKRPKYLIKPGTFHVSVRHDDLYTPAGDPAKIKARAQKVPGQMHIGKEDEQDVAREASEENNACKAGNDIHEERSRVAYHTPTSIDRFDLSTTPKYTRKGTEKHAPSTRKHNKEGANTHNTTPQGGPHLYSDTKREEEEAAIPPHSENGGRKSAGKTDK